MTNPNSKHQRPKSKLSAASGRLARGARIAFAVIAPPVIPCAPNVPCISGTTQQSGGNAIRSFIVDTFGSSFIKGFLGVAAVAAVIFIIVGGLQLLLAAGNEESIKRGKNTLIWAVLGLFIAILSAAIVKIIAGLQF